MTTGLEDLETSLQVTNDWLREVGTALGVDRQHSLHALRAVLTTLRDRLPARQSARLAAELPLLVRGLFYESYQPDDVPLPLRTQEEFVTLVARRFGNIGPVSPRAASINVLRVLRHHLSYPLLETVKDSLPTEIRALFRTEPEISDAGPHRDMSPNRTGLREPAPGDSASRDWGTALSGQEHDPRIRPDRLP